MSKHIVYLEKEYGVILLNRSQKRNAISIEMAREMLEILDEIQDHSIKFLVIKSAGEKNFCAGGDLHDFHDSLHEKEALKRLETMKKVLVKIVTFPVPTICLLQGDALGGGCELATACDIRIAKENTKFGFVQSNIGILPGWGGGALLYEKVHRSFALQWITEGKMYDADFLHQRGWIHQIIREPEWEDEMIVLNDFLKKSTEQMRLLKRQYIESLSIPILIEKMDEESRRCASIWDSEHHKRVVRQFFNK